MPEDLLPVYSTAIGLVIGTAIVLYCMRDCLRWAYHFAMVGFEFRSHSQGRHQFCFMIILFAAIVLGMVAFGILFLGASAGHWSHWHVVPAFAVWLVATICSVIAFLKRTEGQVAETDAEKAAGRELGYKMSDALRVRLGRKPRHSQARNAPPNS